MTQERRAQSPQPIDNERLQALQQFRRNIDPFQETREGEIARAHGLSNFYLQMADPSIEYLEAVSGGLLELSFGNMRELQFATYEAGDNPAGYFSRHGVEVVDTERLQAGIGNSFELINDVVHRFDYDTEEPREDDAVDPKALAEKVHEQIQVRNGERAIRKTVEVVRAEPDLRRRYRMGLNLKKQVLGYIGSFPFTFSRRYGDEPVDSTWENLTQISGLSTELKTKGGGSTSGSFGLEDAVDTAQAAILRYPLEKKLEQLPKRDKEQFDELRLQYGAKGANLILLSEMVGSINRLRRDRYGLQIAVPDFKVVSVDSYNAWKEGKLVDEALLPHFEWASGLKDDDRWYSGEPAQVDYIVRSSAVFSEDGEDVTGAGVYESVRVHGGATFEEFKDAVTRVYASTESPQAQAYREQHGIAGEEMGLVIQKFISPRSYGMHNQSSAGYINSRLTGVPQLMEVVTGTSRNFVKRRELDFVLAMDARRDEGAFRDVQQFPPDQYKIRPDLPVKVAQLTAVVERIWGKDIQVEFVAEGSTINFVQVRELPEAALGQGIEVQFPDEPPIHTGASIGVGDMELDVLDSRRNNTEKVGVAVFQGNYMWTMEGDAARLPKDGAVIITNDDGKNGHIQTLAAENGLICMFPDVYDEDKPTLRYHELSNLDSIRIVSNGIEARVYEGRKDTQSNDREEGIVLYDNDYTNLG